MEADRIPPQDILAERCLLTGMALDKVILANAIEKLLPEHFYHTTHRKIFTLFCENKNSSEYLLQKAIECDPELNISSFLEMGFSVTGKHEIDSIIDKFRRRNAIKICNDAINKYYEDDEKEIITTTKTISELNTIYEYNDRLTRFSDLIQGQMDELQQIITNKTAAYIKTGLLDLDSRLCITKFDYVVLGGRPSNFKSTLASQINRKLVKEGKTVLHFVLDTERGKEVRRGIFSEAEINLAYYENGYAKISDCEKLEQSILKNDFSRYFIDDTTKITIDKIYAKSVKTKSMYGGIDLITIDFMQNIFVPGNMTLREKVNVISSELHALPREIGCPVLALSQMARYPGEESNQPQLYHLKESGNIEADADIIMLVYAPLHYRDCSKDHKLKNLLQVNIAKNKNGPTGEVELNVFPNILKITNRENNGWD